jgi:hypothetical protein
MRNLTETEIEIKNELNLLTISDLKNEILKSLESEKRTAMIVFDIGLEILAEKCDQSEVDEFNNELERTIAS